MISCTSSNSPFGSFSIEACSQSSFERSFVSVTGPPGSGQKSQRARGNGIPVLGRRLKIVFRVTASTSVPHPSGSVRVPRVRSRNRKTRGSSALAFFEGRVSVCSLHAPLCLHQSRSWRCNNRRYIAISNNVGALSPQFRRRCSAVLVFLLHAVVQTNP